MSIVNADQAQDQNQRSDTVDQSDGPEPTAQLSVLSSTVRLDVELKERMKAALSIEYPYSEILQELESEREVTRGSEKFRVQQGLLVRHLSGVVKNDESFWRVVVPDDQNIKTTIMTELHSVPYAGHPGFQRTLQKVKRTFYWKGMTGDVQSFVLSCPVCQLEKAEHTLVRGQLQPIQLPDQKWKEVSLDFVTDLPKTSAGEDTILNVIDRATRMVHCIPCKKTITGVQTARKYWQFVGKLHGVPNIIYSDRGSVFIGAFWRELWVVLGTQLRFSTAYHPQTQGVIEKMNQLASQTLRLCDSPIGRRL